ncbi:MAG: hypothetical protein HQL60_04320 [Magnetococcales bacterium]|nr:hypothetical protein [Magnetococcales bacterium]
MKRPQWWSYLVRCWQQRSASEPVTRSESYPQQIDWPTILDSIADGILILDHQWLLHWYNIEAGQQLGLEQHDLGRVLFGRVSLPLLEDYIGRADFNRPLQMPAPLRGDVMLELRFRSQGDGSFWLVLVRDISHHYQIDQQQTDFLVNVSHELKTPVTVFRAMLETIPDMPERSFQWQQAWTLLQQQVERMQAIIDNQITLLKMGEPDRHYATEAIAMEPLMTALVEEARVLSGPRQHRFVLAIDPEVQLVANRGLIQCIVANLLTNAVCHTAPQTEVQLIWRCDDRGQPLLTVRDNGGGIAAYHLPRLTDKYYRVSTAQTAADHSGRCHGSGLGLTLVKQALARCQAQLEISSHPGVGSSFSCRFQQS